MVNLFLSSLVHLVLKMKYLKNAFWLSDVLHCNTDGNTDGWLWLWQKLWVGVNPCMRLRKERFYNKHQPFDRIWYVKVSLGALVLKVAITTNCNIQCFWKENAGLLMFCVSLVCLPLEIFLSTINWEETLVQNLWYRLYMSTSLGTPTDPCGGAKR